ncbi:UDP-N-acetylmuramoylalanyl-D-glutamate--2,6-diaminopimelate ligase [Branchiibius hedensis]|uniref:UDP-N-acetylmuramyl-tripeptide synthetase n=1 Tax=Branchiibius hedensis TaxID=672460 RepID=A0A2Y8ZVE3_9MICO|nr:UDP-N-acetylmuramoyl-L-alanyl-D-glutamate--2,6-diaminopimelate ligase [Branchiibius hedensis]PWJ27233.1 UDP-N-acetylmuramoylalanyl-D-glutamate--2,6-diaminopimelate ligase [Branchiibius hedensis]SSA36044.1 UDP-N-acetylmuramoylalanyl-D-glutamate--2,6-diaminopimelate ligase [Branchiibius hedensis]
MILDGSALRDVLGVEVPEVQVSAVTNDSRAVSPGSAYVAIKGFTTDGARFVPQALEQGATLIVADHPIDGAPTAVVPDTRAAMARLAVAVNGDPSKDLTVYGITGTNGKTTSSYVLHGILSSAYGAAKTGLLSTAEIIVGTERRPAVRTTGEAPLVQGTLARMRDEGVQYVVLETSSHGIALQRVAGTHYAAALFTNLSRDHLDFHPTMEDYYLTKRRLFEWTDGPKLANSDDPYGARLADEVSGTLRFGTTTAADYQAVAIEQTSAGTDFVLRTPTMELPLHMPLLGDYNVLNVTGAAAIALETGMDPDILQRAVADIPQVPGRFERVPNDKGFEVIVDYAHTDVGLAAVLDVARAVTEGRVIVVYGAAGRRDPAKRPKMGAVATQKADIGIITTDDSYDESPEAIAAEVKAGAPDHEVILDRREAIERALATAKSGDLVLIAGKGHERVQHLPDGDIDFHDATVAAELLSERG